MMKTKIINRIIVGGALAFALPFLRSDWTIASLCDGCSVAGVLLLSYVGLQFLRNQNAFFGVSFLFERIKSYFLPWLWKESHLVNEEVVEKEKRNVDKIMLAVGLGYLGIAVIFLFFI